VSAGRWREGLRLEEMSRGGSALMGLDLDLDLDLWKASVWAGPNKDRGPSGNFFFG